jgi:membrane protease YdiL (CAAX protease family)
MNGATPRPPAAVAPYFALAFAITWGLQLPALLAYLGALDVPVESLMAPAGLGGAFGPMLAAMIASRLGGESAKAPFRELRRWRVSPLWYAIALGLPLALTVATTALYRALGGGDEVAWAYPPAAPERVIALFLFPFGEEIGWRGLAYPRLRERASPLAAGLIVGCAWALWHVPMFVLAGFPPSAYPVAFAQLVAGSVVYAWLVERTGGSLLLAVLAHAGAHLCNVSQPLPANVTPLALQTAGFVAVAVAVVALDARTLRARPTR